MSGVVVQDGRFGPYSVVAPLAQGGMGVTYLARDDRGREVVIKTIRPELVADPDFRTRFRREAEAARLFRSVLVARVWGFDCDADLPWIALEQIDGPTLADVVAHQGPLDGERLGAFAADLAEAVHAFFDQGLAHGDLTPSNVVLQDGARLKILDLGLTRPTADQAVTVEGPVFGTPYWEAPEVAAGFHPDSASDVNQWAKLVLFAGTGYGRNSGQPLRDALDELPTALRALVERCLNPVPEARPSPRELWRATRQRAATGPVVDQDRTRPIPKPALPRSSRRVPIWALAIAASLVALVGVAYAIGHHRGSPAGDRLRGPVIDQARWAVEREDAASITAGDGAVFKLASSPSAPSVSATLSSRCAFVGDFDVEVAYHLDEWPPGNHGRVGILAESDAVERISEDDGEFYAGQTDQALTRQPTADASGFLRLVRSGTTVFGYQRVRATDAWTQVFSAANATPLRSHVDLRVWGAGSDTTRTVTMHDYRINDGTC